MSKQKNKTFAVSQDPTQPLQNFSFVFTGVMELKRDDCIKMIERYGGKNQNAVSKKTSFLVYGPKLEDGRDYTQGSKYRKAQECNVPTFNEAEFAKYMQNKCKVDIYNNNKNSESQAIATKTNLSIEEISSMKNQMNDITIPKSMQNIDPSHFQSLWVDKYKPKKSADLVGNANAINILKTWLRNWKEINVDFTFDNKSNSSKINYNSRCALLSGNPGIGKTSAARIICEELGLKYFETNASNTRSAKALKNSPMLKSVEGYQMINGQNTITNNMVLIFDEVDGMSSGDRGGNAQLLNFVRATSFPIICICNDAKSQKMRNFETACVPIRFVKPLKTQIVPKLKDICKREGFNVDDNALNLIIESNNADIRACITNLEIIAKASLMGKITYDSVAKHGSTKDANSNTGFMEAARTLLSASEFRGLSARDKLDLFFVDHSLIPLCVHENYLTTIGSSNHQQDFNKMAEAAECIAFADCIQAKIMREQQWSLLVDYGRMSTLVPCTYACGSLTFPAFPKVLGQMSSMRKYKGVISEFEALLRAAKCVSIGGRTTISSEYVYYLEEIINESVHNEGNFSSTVDLFYDLHLTNELYSEVSKLSFLERNNESMKSDLYNMVKRRQDDADKVKEVKKKRAVLEAKYIIEEEADNEVVDEDEDETIVKLKTKAKKAKGNKTNAKKILK